MSISFIPGVESAGAALSAERTRLNVVANNIANATTTRDASGQDVYRRKLVVFESVLAQQIAGSSPQSSPSYQVRVSDIIDDPRPLKSVYMPGHPHAKADGMVEMPNVNIAEEMVDMITASRSIEANVQVITTAKQMMQRALDIGRR